MVWGGREKEGGFTGGTKLAPLLPVSFKYILKERKPPPFGGEGGWKQGLHFFFFFSIASLPPKGEGCYFRVGGKKRSEVGEVNPRS